jgi:rfaE bifunctional protein nucleotidyltransferase chain/domain
VIIDFKDLATWRSQVDPGAIVATNGVFDVIHIGHIRLIKKMVELGARMVIGINSDQSTRQLKGLHRPINSAEDRAELLDYLKPQYLYITIFDSIDAVDFLSAVKPSIWVKGGDYTAETVNKDELATVERNGGKLVLFNEIRGYHTTETLDKIRKL